MELQKVSHTLPSYPEISPRMYHKHRIDRGQQDGSQQFKMQNEEKKLLNRDRKQLIDSLQTNLKFVYHDELNEYYVEVINPHTNEIIKEIPPKKILDMFAAMADRFGLFIDREV